MPRIETASVPAHRIPMPTWQAVCQIAAAITREAARDRRPAQLESDAHALVAALAAVGVSVEPVRVRSARTGRCPLSDREVEVLIGIGEGKSNAEIGQVLYVSEQTIKTHVRGLFRKLGARDRAHAVAIGIRTDLIT